MVFKPTTAPGKTRCVFIEEAQLRRAILGVVVAGIDGAAGIVLEVVADGLDKGEGSVVDAL